MESFDEEWKLLSGSFVLTLKPALSSVTAALMDICDHCLCTCCYEILEVAVHCKKNTVCVHTPQLLEFILLHILLVAYV